MTNPLATASTPSQPEVDVLTIGHALVDIVAGADDAFLEAEGMTKGAMQLIDDDRAADLYSRMGSGTETSGGAAANTATGVTACGGSAAFIGTVTNDQLGEVFAHDIRAAGVRYRTPPVETSKITGRSMILVTPDGERTMNTNIGSAGLVSMEHLNHEWLAGAAITYVEGYLLDDAHPFEAWDEAAKVIHHAGRRFSVTLSDSFCVQRHRELFQRLLNGPVDICFGNEDELLALYEVDDLDVALRRVAEHCEIAAITRGARGSVLVSGDERVEVRAEPTSVIDTTGAGDFYAAGVLAGLARGWGLERSGRLGSRAASAVISRMGARLSGEQLSVPE